MSVLPKLHPKVAQTIYQVGLIASSAVTVAAIWHGIDGGTVTSLNNAITALLGLLGVGATATANVRVGAQRKDGTLDFSGSAAQQAVDALAAVDAQAAASAADLDRVRAAAAAVAGSIPVVGPLAQQVIQASAQGI